MCEVLGVDAAAGAWLAVWLRDGRYAGAALGRRWRRRALLAGVGIVSPDDLPGGDWAAAFMTGGS